VSTADEIARVAQSLAPLERAVLTFALLALFYAWWRLGRRIASDARDEYPDNILDGLLAVLALGTLVIAAGTTVVIWSSNPITTAVRATVESNSALGAKFALTVALVVGAYIVTGFVHRTVDDFVAARANITDHEAEVVYRVVQVTLYVAVFVTALGVWEVNLSGLLIGAGFAGIVLGMAARQTLGAVLAGFVLMFARPFEIGDWVKIGENDGIVTDITIVNTRIQTFDGEYVMLPNDYVGSEEIINRSRKGRIRLHVEVGVDYNSDVDHAREVAKDALSDIDDVLTVPQPQVVLTEFGPSSVVLDLRFWIDKPSARRKWRAHTAVISAVHEAFREEDITIPFPQRELSTRDAGVRIPDDQPGGGHAPGEGGDG